MYGYIYIYIDIHIAQYVERQRYTYRVTETEGVG